MQHTPMEPLLGKLAAQLEQWGAKLAKLSAEANEGGAETSVDRKYISELKAKHLILRAKLDAVRGARSQEWNNLKGSIEGAWRELDFAFKELTN